VLSSAFSESIEGVTVGEIMAPRPEAIDASTPAAAAQEDLERRGWPWSAVVDDDGRFLGILDATSNGDAPTAGEAVPESDRREFAVTSATPLEALLGSEPLRRLGALVVVDGGGLLVGVVTVEQVHRALAAAAPGR
jgi:CBS domain-containing protein